MDSFSSKTQYHKDFGLTGNHNVCSFFSLHFSNLWLNKKTINEETYLNALKKAVDLFKILELKDIDFNTLLSFSEGYTGKNVKVTMVDFIKDDPNILNDLFKLDESKCFIFLKHEKFFVVICDQENKKWHILDCHMVQQRSFTDYDLFLETIMHEYNFGSTITIDGYPLVEYSTIEYVLLDKPFDIKLGMGDQGDTKKEGKAENKTTDYDEDLAKALMASLSDLQLTEDEMLFKF